MLFPKKLDKTSSLLLFFGAIMYLTMLWTGRSFAVESTITLVTPQNMGALNDDIVITQGQVVPVTDDISDVQYQIDATSGSWSSCSITNSDQQTDFILDPDFDSGSGANAAIFAIATQQDGKAIIGGTFTSYNGISQNRIARVNVDGSLDTDFNIGVGANSTVQAIAVQSDGKILIGGTFTSVNGTARNYIARLNSDGTTDSSFNTSLNGTVYSITIQANGKIVIGGAFTTYNKTSINRIARLESNGALDATFSVGTGASGEVRSIVLQNDNKILVGGAFTSFNSVSNNRIIRLNSNGSIDSSFITGVGANSTVYTIALQADGKVLIGGNFSTYNTVSRPRLARLESDGSLDTAFDVGDGANNYVYAITALSDDSIIVGGMFSTFNSVSQSNLVKLDESGSVDVEFDIGGVSGTVFQIVARPDGKLALAGSFTNIDGHPTNLGSLIPPINYRDFVCSIQTAGLSQGNHKVYIRALDVKTVPSENEEVEFILDTEAPAKVLITNIENISKIPIEDNLTFSLTDDTPLIIGSAEAGSDVTFLKGDSKYITIANYDGSYSIVIANPDLTIGQNDLIYYAVDSLGNKSEERTLTLFVNPAGSPNQEVSVIEADQPSNEIEMPSKEPLDQGNTQEPDLVDDIPDKQNEIISGNNEHGNSAQPISLWKNILWIFTFTSVGIIFFIIISKRSKKRDESNVT